MGLNKEQLQLVAINRERKRELAKRARDTDTVLSEIREQLDQRASDLGLSPQAYRNLLEDPEAYKKFLALTNGNGFNSELAKPKRTQVKSKHSGTIFNTTNWDPLFNRNVREKIEQDL